MAQPGTLRQGLPPRGIPDRAAQRQSQAEEHAAFTGAKATCDARVGGIFTAYDGYISGRIVELETGERIVQEWRTTEWPPGADRGSDGSAGMPPVRRPHRPSPRDE